MRTILFDIDFTLINTEVLRAHTTEKILQTFQIPRKQYIDLENSYAKTLKATTHFNLYVLLKVVADGTGASKDKVESVWKYKQSYIEATYSDVLPTLKQLSKKYRLGILSYGVSCFQKRKLDFMGVSKLFDKRFIFISKDSMSEEGIRRLPRHSIIVDDNVGKLEDIFKRAKAAGIDVCPVVINRKAGSEVRNISQRLSVVKSLSELKCM